MKRIFIRSLLVSLLILSFQPVLAKNTHCLQQSISEFGNTRTCIKNLSLTDEQFEQVCNPGQDEYVKVSSKYISSCPAGYKGVCKGLKFGDKPLPYLSYLYENDMAFMRQSCLSNGGIWEDGDV